MKFRCSFTNTEVEKSPQDIADKAFLHENNSYEIGDVDELIFPDDEPYYISQR